MSETRLYNGEKYLIPSVITFIVFGIVPVLFVIHTGFTQWAATGVGGQQWIGWDNYRDIVNTGQWLASIVRTLFFVGVSLVIQMTLGLAIALLLNREFRGEGVVRALIVLPLTIPPLSVGANWLLFLRQDTGMFSKYLQQIGIQFSLDTTVGAWVGIFLMDAWHWVPLIALIFLAGLTSVSPSLIESAKIDGATRWEIFRHVELPHLKTVGMVALLIRMMDLFRAFDSVWMLTAGGPSRETMLLNLDIVRLVTEKTWYGLGSAMSLIALYMIIMLSWFLINFLHTEVLG